MGNDLAKLHRELSKLKQTSEVKSIRKNVEEKLGDQMRMHFLALLEIGGITGYDNLESELRKAAEIVGKLKKIK